MDPEIRFSFPLSCCKISLMFSDGRWVKAFIGNPNKKQNKSGRE
jgi:hypothetical protein